MGREVPFDKDDVCDECGAVGAYDFMGDLICGACSSKYINCECCGKPAINCRTDIIRDCQTILAEYLPPDGISAADAINRLLEILDGPRGRAAVGKRETP